MSLRFFFIAGGICTLYFIFSILQERLLKGVYGDEEEKFTYTVPLLFIATLFNAGYAYLMKTVNQAMTVEDHTPTLMFCCIAFPYFLAMITSFMALQWVSYPAQVIAKSAKPIPVLIMGVLIGKKYFPVRKYFIIFLMVLGVTMFFYKEEKASKRSDTAGFGIGEVLLIMSLLMDGLTNSLQERVMAKYSPNSEQMMFEVNKWSIVFGGVTVLITGEGLQCLKFMVRHPESILQIFILCICGAVGQFFIYMCLTEFGTLTCSVITTTRKFFTVLSSVIIFRHVLLMRQWIGVLFVFTALFLDIYFGNKNKKIVQK